MMLLWVFGVLEDLENSEFLIILNLNGRVTKVTRLLFWLVKNIGSEKRTRQVKF
jgi:hypothetical protein